MKSEELKRRLLTELLKTTVLTYDNKEIRNAPLNERIEKANHILDLVDGNLERLTEGSAPNYVFYGLRVAIELAEKNEVVLGLAHGVAARYNIFVKKDNPSAAIVKLPIYQSVPKENGFDLKLVESFEI